MPLPDNRFFPMLNEALQTIRAARPFILSAVLVYCAAAVAGWVYPGELQFMEDQFMELAKRFQDLNFIEFSTRIFMHNLVASYLAMCFVTLFGIIPMILAAFNGLLLGWFAGWLPEVSWMQLAVMLVPHGMFEWPAMFIAFGVGMWRGMGGMFTGTTLTWWQLWKKANYAYFFVVVPLLFVAAIIEGRYHLLT
ncbi:stage II sporulation protein M [Desulfonatronovibrio magnus]|uniref:stage II sporulation protein M n=1 Tax=Desulfonatronovibrio magnus TaxID=698827 RepID=UPI0005EAFD2D|nr:stage II sporulation protein M [Desulfonatronovibrio magnus]